MNEVAVSFSDAHFQIINAWVKRYRVTPGQFCQAFVLMGFEGLDSHISDIGETVYDTIVLDVIEKYVDESTIPEWLAEME
ncbi:hypothetical protein [Cerasicoccus arenae]|uniref:Uncharacterized protein n=1 Tax=Cerasicoccus arenae TaxID=424488 RepID=A0A8J3DDT0_9BACT|nr:hypothetical protein [Cerasicoccus arenae]MBK1858756.1 hypothetical protein [Cerasicoccus arenae]GHC07305.1 hypothetical protein GCM10007047_25520 [Cerasicoccus arenae]